MDMVTAKDIATKTRAFQHCDKLLKKIDKYGEAWIKINNTGFMLKACKDDAVYLRIQAQKYALLDEIKSYQVTQEAKAQKEQPIRRVATAPFGAAELTDEEKLERKREKHREAQRRYLAKKLAEKKGQTPT